MSCIHFSKKKKHRKNGKIALQRLWRGDIGIVEAVIRVTELTDREEKEAGEIGGR